MSSTLQSELILKGDNSKTRTNGGNKRNSRVVVKEIKSVHRMDVVNFVLHKTEKVS